MAIKIFDIVECKGYQGRVMRTPSNGSLTNSVVGSVDVSDATLIESVDIPTFEVGDLVRALPIPGPEKSTYPQGWDERMSHMIGGEDAIYKVTDLHYSLACEYPAYQLYGHFWFSPYHLEKIAPYNMI